MGHDVEQENYLRKFLFVRVCDSMIAPWNSSINI